MKRRGTTNSVTDRLAELSEGLRLRILRLLEAEELSVGEVSQVVQLPQSTVSRHLKVLGDGEWLVRRNEGTATLYRLHLDDLSPECRALWRTVREQLVEDGDCREDLRRLRGVLDERKTDSQTFFGRAGGEWDAIRGELFGSGFTSLALLSLIDRRWTVADLGCGTANVAELLSPVVHRVIAVDQSDVMLAAAQRRLAGRDNIHFATGTLDRLPIGRNEVDVCVCSLVLHHLDEPLGAMQEMRRVLTPIRGGGIALIVDMVKHDRDEYRRTMGHRHLGFSADEFTGLARAAGFAEASYRELPSQTQAKGPGLFVGMARTRVEGAE